MISDRYLWRDKVRMSDKKVDREEALIPVRRRLIKAVFFLRAESRDLLTGNTSMGRSSETRRSKIISARG